MRVKAFFAAASASLFLIASGKIVAQEKHPEHPKSKQEHPTDKKQAGLTKAELAAAIRNWVEKESARELRLEEEARRVIQRRRW